MFISTVKFLLKAIEILGLHFNKHFEGSCELLRFDADKLLHFQSCFCSLLYKCTQNYFTIQVYTKPVYQVYTKLVTNKWNIQGQNITNYLSYLLLPLATCN